MEHQLAAHAGTVNPAPGSQVTRAGRWTVPLNTSCWPFKPATRYSQNSIVVSRTRETHSNVESEDAGRFFSGPLLDIEFCASETVLEHAEFNVVNW